MAEFALFIGWGATNPGREIAATKVFGEAVAYWTGLEAAGEIESYETVILGYHGGDLAGFALLRGDPERLGGQHVARVPAPHRRAAAVVKNVGVVNAALDTQALRWVGETNQALADLI